MQHIAFYDAAEENNRDKCVRFPTLARTVERFFRPSDDEQFGGVRYCNI